MTDMPDPREFDECAYEGWGQADWLAVDARLARLAAGAQAENEAIVKGVVDAPASTTPPPAASFQCVPCECGGQCDQCKAREENDGR